MTRVNVIAPSELVTKHLVAEYREIVRVFGLAKKNKSPKIPNVYTLGTGHVTFFYNKLLFILKRYNSLILEMKKRGFNPNPISDETLLDGVPDVLLNDYVPTQEAIEINRGRIQERLIDMKN